jgi:hypothetical protein
MHDVEISIRKSSALLVKHILNNYASSDVRELSKLGEVIYELEQGIARVWDENHDQDAMCTCNHIYHRHFDGYDDMRAVGCKYCECWVFNERV